MADLNKNRLEIERLYASFRSAKGIKILKNCFISEINIISKLLN